MLYFFLRASVILSEDGEESEALPVAFRYNIVPSRSRSTHVFRPNQLQGEPRAGSLGALWMGKFDKLPANKLLDVLWEAGPGSVVPSMFVFASFCRWSLKGPQ